jgi:hypothetical protein
MWPQPWRVVRGAMLMRPRRSVAALALAQARVASDPAVRSRLCAMAAQTSQAAFAGNDPEGRWARGNHPSSVAQVVYRACQRAGLPAVGGHPAASRAGQRDATPGQRPGRDQPGAPSPGCGHYLGLCQGWHRFSAPTGYQERDQPRSVKSECPRFQGERQWEELALPRSLCCAMCSACG